MRLLCTKKPRTVKGPAALSFYVCPSLKPSSRPRLYDDYRYAIPYNRYAADQFVMVHKNNTFREKHGDLYDEKMVLSRRFFIPARSFVCLFPIRQGFLKLAGLHGGSIVGYGSFQERLVETALG
jgi:hypothetical protein